MPPQWPVLSLGFPLCGLASPVFKSFETSMNILLLGRGKTGSLVAEIATERRHHVRIAGAKENADAAALRPEKIAGTDTVVDFTAPHCVMANIEASIIAGKNMVVGTTGWYNEVDRVKEL